MKSWSDILQRNSEPQCWLFVFLVSLILRFPAGVEKLSGGDFFSYEIHCVTEVQVLEVWCHPDSERNLAHPPR